MKKKVLFVMNNLHVGGAEKSLISLFETMDFDRYEVDLFLFKHEGLFLSKLPGHVRLLDEQPAYRYFEMPLKRAFKACLRNNRPILAYSRLRAGYIFRKSMARARQEQNVWAFKSRAFSKLDQHYDAAIGFLELTPIYFIIDKVIATTKIGWIHTNYDSAGMDPVFDRKYFNQLDHLVTVSHECANVLHQRFKELNSRIRVIHNIVSPSLIRKMAAFPVPNLPVSGQNEMDTRHDSFMIVTVARLSREKGIDLAIEACKLLVDDGYKITWYVIGGGSEEMRLQLDQQIRRLGLEQSFVLYGESDNPYPFVRQADVYVQPSRYEGKSIALDEAKILGKPIVATRFGTVQSQLVHGENGWITDMNPTALFEGIRRLICDRDLREKFREKLAMEQLGTEEEIHKVYELIEQE